MLVNTARMQGNEKLAMIIQTICGTGIRVSELQYITAEAVACGEAVVRLKGKTRIILIAGKLKKTAENIYEAETDMHWADFCNKKSKTTGSF